jgi:aldose 1-epimerase
MKPSRSFVALILVVICLPAFAQQKQSFGKTKDGTEVFAYTLKNKGGMEARITNFGGVVQSLMVPDRNGKMADVVLGFDKLADYEKTGPYFGALIGRYGNRIRNAEFKLDGKTYHLAKNNGPNTLHGGNVGFDKRVWDVKAASPNSLHLHYLSKDGEEGFPGNLNVDVVYTVTDNNELKIDYSATTDKDTVLNLTNHSYFNLKGQGNGDILQHKMMINASRFTPVNDTLIPTGELKPVAGTPFDFTKSTEIGARINAKDQQIVYGKGYDHNFVLNGTAGKMRSIATVTEPTTGRVLDVSTDQPGVQFYTGNFLDGTQIGKGGKPYQQRYAFCLETQHFPDSPNQPKFPTTELKPGQKYHSTTIYKFSTQK